MTRPAPLEDFSTTRQITPTGNFYPVVVTEDETWVGNARWGRDRSKAASRARIDAWDFIRRIARRGVFVYDAYLVIAESREQVTVRYELPDNTRSR